MSANVGELAEPLRSRVRALLAEADGRVVIVSGFRTRAEQIELRKANCGTDEWSIFQKPSSECNPETARPGESKHERGLAVDLGGDLQLADQLAARHGLVRTVEGENWHYELSGNEADRGGRGGLGTAVGGVVEALPGPNPLTAVQAGGRFAELLTRRDTWLRVLGVLVGIVALGAGLGIIAADLGAVPLSALKRSARSSGSVAAGADGLDS